MVVLDRAEDFERARKIAIYARLLNLSERWRAEVEADPWPFIDQMMERLHRAEDALKAVDDALNPLPGMVPNDSPIVYTDPLREEYKRNRKVRELIRTWQAETA